MKKTSLIIILVLILSCKSESKQIEYQEIRLSEKTVIRISPDSTEIEKIRLEMGNSKFYTMTDDLMWYNAQMLEVIDSLKINLIQTNKKLIKVITPKKQIEINNEASEVKWRYFYFDGNTIVEKDVFELIELKDSIN